MKLRYYLPETMTHDQEIVLAEISRRLVSYGWREKFIREWWQTPARNLNGFCPLEALCADKFDLVHLCLDDTVRKYEANLKQIEETRKVVNDALS